jgi:peroxiredoxin Q/BCP
MVAEGTKLASSILNLQLADHTGKMRKLSEFLGNPLLLYFYPKNNTPGCTTQACDIRDTFNQFTCFNYTVVGVSPDSPESHINFREKYKLPFILLSDPDHLLANVFGVFKEKNMYGKKSMGIERSTFLINNEGLIIRALRKVSAKNHANLILELVKQP